MNNEELQRLKELAKAATPGPWFWKSNMDGDSSEMGNFHNAEGKMICNFGNDGPLSSAEGMEPDAEDIAFICAANPSSVLQLVEIALRASLPVADDVDSVEFRHLLGTLLDVSDCDDDGYANAREPLIAHLNAHVAAAVAKAREEEAIHPDGESYVHKLEETERALQYWKVKAANRQHLDMSGLEDVRIWLVKSRPPLTLSAGARVNEYLAALKVIEDILAQPSQQPAPGADDAPKSDIPAKAMYWFSCLTKCARLLNIADDQPIPSGVVAAVEKLVADAASVDAKPVADLREKIGKLLTGIVRANGFMREVVYLDDLQKVLGDYYADNPSPAQADVKPSQQDGGKIRGYLTPGNEWTEFHSTLEAAQAACDEYNFYWRSQPDFDPEGDWIPEAVYRGPQPSDKLQQASIAAKDAEYWRNKCEALLDMWDDSHQYDETRMYVPGALRDTFEEIRKELASIAQAEPPKQQERVTPIYGAIMKMPKGPAIT